MERALIASLLPALWSGSPREVVDELFAHRVMNFTGPDGVVWTEAEEPVADGGVVVDVVAAGVSYADLLQTTGAYQLQVPVPFTPGMDAAGVVRSTPPDVGLRVGQRRRDAPSVAATARRRGASLPQIASRAGRAARISSNVTSGPQTNHPGEAYDHGDPS